MISQTANIERFFVISDLHLGGRPPQPSSKGNAQLGTNLCTSYGDLRDFIDWVRRSVREEERTTLVIAGDIVDFLADDEIAGSESYAQSWTDSEERAIAKLAQIVMRSRSTDDDGPFDALERLVSAGHRLVLLIGNHDVELALPAVRRRLMQQLDADGRGQVEFIYDGEAFSYGDLLIEHGNRYDRFNQIDHSQLRQERSMASRGLAGTLERSDRYFQPPPGTLLVIHIINRLKAKYRFVDLLKPETEAVIPLLLFLEPDIKFVLEKILVLSKVAKGAAVGGMSRDALTTKRTGNLNSSGRRRAEKSDAPELGALLAEQLGPQRAAEILPVVASAGNMSSGGRGEDQLADRASARVDAWIRDVFKATANISTQVRRIPKDRLDLLRHVLRCATKSHAFDLGHESDEYLSAARALTRSGRFSTVIFGHTHLPKKIELDCANKPFPVYVNSGTWADIIRLPRTIFEEQQWRGPLEEFVESMRTNDYSAYIAKCPTYVEVRMVDAKVRDVELRRFGGAGSERLPVYG
jgi:UDP-2,3-diacylglucosamine pyrophosphatase LpxH